jgi:DNA-binding transcriptional LysR family regulator
MQHRHQHTNIPTEIIRTLVVIAETGSFTKAGEKLGLSQPAISAQVKRLQTYVGGAVFDKTSGGVALTPRGNLVMTHARRFLDANDHILSLGGTVSDTAAIRVGMSVFYMDQFLAAWKKERSAIQVNFESSNSGSLAKGFADGYLDVVCMLYPTQDDVGLVESWTEEIVWVRSKDFVLSPGAPIPLVSWLGNRADLPSIKALEKSGLNYRIAFASSDHHSRLSAVAAGIGIMALPRRHAADPLVIAQEYYLPPLEPLRAGIYVRAGVDMDAVEPVVKVLRKLSRPDQPARDVERMKAGRA